MKVSDESFRFSHDFLWGAATAAHQVEGNNHNQWSVWEKENAASLATSAEKKYRSFDSWPRVKRAAMHADNYVSAAASNNFEEYERDFDFLTQMNMNSYRFSIEWARIQPTEETWDDQAIAHYRRMLQSLKKRNIEPVVTLFHFTLPTWFADKGGFEKKANVVHFIAYVEKMMTELGDLMTYVITINEPTVYASISYLAGMWPPARKNPLLAVKVTNILAYAHNEAARTIHSIGTGYQVSISHNSPHFIAMDGSIVTKMTIGFGQYIMDDLFLRKVIDLCDFVGINYYMTHQIKGVRLRQPKRPVTDLNWSIEPADIQHVLERIHKTYHKPIMITENGLADATDTHRKYWIEQTIIAMEKASQNGVSIIGYLHWSLMDNFEWAFGKWPRFGLVAVDYTTGKKTLRKSAQWFGTRIALIRRRSA